MPDAKRTSSADPEVLAFFPQELARTAALPGLAAAGPALWPHFAGYYLGLARLPRKVRRALQRRWRRSLGSIALLCALGQAPDLAATISVGGGCTLVDAITAANNDAVTGGCTAGSGADSIELPFGSTTTLTTVNNNTYGPTGLPVITSEIFIFRGGAITRDSNAPPFRILAVSAAGKLTGSLTVSGGLARFASEDMEAAGGGIYNRGRILLLESTISGNTADGRGGGIHNEGTLIFDGTVLVSGNTAGSGGGIFNQGTLTFTRSTVEGNSARYRCGGGIFSVGEDVTLTDSTISGNTAVCGGGIHNRGTLTLTNSVVSSNTAAGNGGPNQKYGAGNGGGIYSTRRFVSDLHIYFYPPSLTLNSSTVSGNKAVRGGGILNGGTLTLTNSALEGNSAEVSGGAIRNDDGILTLTGSAVSGNTASDSAGGIENFSGDVTLINSTVEDNSAQSRGGGISNRPGFKYLGTRYAGILTLNTSTISGNSAGTSGGGVDNDDRLTLTNSTVSGNTAADRGGGIENTRTMTLTSSTVARNASGRVAGGLFNTGTVTLVQTLLSGNTAPVIAPEAYNGLGTVIGDSFNLFGHDSFSGVAGFTLGATDLVPAVPLPAILHPALSYNGGPTRTHALVFGSPGVDAVPGATCATGVDQRGAPRPQDADGDTIADCEIGAVERGQIPIQAAILSTTLDCRIRGCRVSVRCNLLETECRNPIDITVRSAAVRAADGTLVRAQSRFRFAAGVTNIPPGGTQTMRLRLTPRGTGVVRKTEKKRLKGLLAIRGIATATNTPPATISNTPVTLRLRRR